MRTILSCCAISLLVLAGCSSGSIPPPGAGKYPPPTGSFEGKTAVDWAPLAKDVNEETCKQGVKALKSLGAEGVPFLLQAAEFQLKPANAGTCLSAIDGGLLHETDIERVGIFLDRDRSDPTARAALVVLQKVGPRAKSLAPRVRPFLDDEPYRQQAKDTLAAIEGN